MTKGNEMMLNTSGEAAKLQTVTGWVSRDGRFWGDDERMARWSGCTHVACRDCGKPVEKSWLACADCRRKKDIEKYLAMPRIDWNGETPLYSDASDMYFFSAEELSDHLTDEPFSIEDLRLIICDPNYARQLESDHFADELPEDGDLPAALEEAIEAFNAAIAKQGPLSWSPGKHAATPESVAQYVGEPATE